MKIIKALTMLFSFCITLPIWYYLLYKILVAVNASELMFFLFWVYVPFAFICAFLSRIVDESK